MRRYIALLLALLAILLLASGCAEETEEEAYPVARGSCGDFVSWELDSEGLLTIRGEGEMESYTDPDARALSAWGGDLDAVRNLVIAPGVTVVGAYSFMNCMNLETVQLPEGLLRIGACAFQNCVSLREVSLPDGLETIWGGAFANCESLKELKIPRSVETIGGNAFLGSGLTDLIRSHEPDVGWKVKDGAMRYYDAAGSMCTGWLQLEDARYYLGEDGARRTGWTDIDGKRYYFDPDGAMHVGWLQLGREQYYLDASGVLVTGTRTVDGRITRFAEDGRLLHNNPYME